VFEIEFLKDWRVYKPGQVTDAIQPGVADVLFKRGIARPVVRDIQVEPLPLAGGIEAAERVVRRKQPRS
jgi:hypothetical protein